MENQSLINNGASIFANYSETEIKTIRDIAPQSKEELKYWLIVFLGVYLFDTPVDPGNSSPLDFVWDVYAKGVLKQKGDGKNYILGCAGRGSQKTLACAVLEFLFLLFCDDRDVIHLASIEAQSKVCYKYVQTYANNPMFNPDRIKSSLMNSTESIYGKTLVVTHGTINAVNAYHASFIVFDEVDLMPKAIFDEAHGMITASSATPGLFAYISSRKQPYGRIEDLLLESSKPDNDVKVHKWGLLEQCSSCSDTRSGTKKVDYYVDEDGLIALNEEEYLRESNKLVYNKISGYEGCYKCGMFSFCKGNLKKEKSPNAYYIPLEIAASWFKKEDLDFIKSQRLNRKPSKIGLVYPMWDETKHLKTYSEMYEVFAGKKQEGVTFEILKQEFEKHNCKPCIGIDWGFTSPFVALLMYIDGKDTVYVIDHITFTGKTDRECVQAIYNRWGDGLYDFFPDIENPSGIQELRNIVNEKQLHWAVRSTVIKDIDIGIGIVRNFLRPPGTNLVKLFVHHSIEILKEEMRKYRYATFSVKKSDRELKDTPEDAWNHSLDAQRYPLATLYYRSFASLYSSALADLAQKAQSAQAPNNVSPQAVMGKLGVDLTPLTEEDIKKNKEDEEKGYKSGGNSGFSWSF